MDGMDVDIPDNEDAACDMDQLESYFTRRGEYENAAMVNGAARRMRADSEERDTRDAEIEELRRDRERIVGLFRAFAQKINRDGQHTTANAIEAICDLAAVRTARTGQKGE